MELLDNFSTREKNLWSELLVDIVVGLYYFPKMLLMLLAGDDALAGKAMAGLVISTVMVAIVAAIIVSVFLHAQKKPEQVDERDHLFASRGAKVAYTVLAACTVLLMGNIVVHTLLPEVAQNRFPVNLSPVGIAHLMLLSLYLSSFIKTVVQLYFYRRGY